MKDIQEKIIASLDAPIPDISFLREKTTLEHIPDLLDLLLNNEISDFRKKLKNSDETITFDTFDEYSSLGYLFGIVEHINSVSGNEQSRKIIENFEPKYIEFSQEISFSKRYYEMLKICLEKGGLNNEQIKILEDAIQGYEVRGIHLTKEKQSRLKEIQLELSDISRKFSENALFAEAEISFSTQESSIISEMPADLQQKAQETAKFQKKTGYQFGSSVSEYISLMKYCSDAGVRKTLYAERNQIATIGKYDNREHILKILKLRHEKAKILGFSNYCELSLHFKMAENADEIQNILNKIAKTAQNKAKKELKMLQDYFQLTSIHAEDIAYYFRKYKEQEYKLDEAELQQYLEYHAVLEGMFYIMHKLYDITLTQIEKVAGADEDIQIFEVHKENKLLSYFIIDPFFRKEKRSGAWANILKEKHHGSIPVVVNVYNINKGDEVTLLRMNEVETIFHEFGHAMHEMFSESRYSELSGFHVEWDFVELPSQFHEHFCRDSQGLEFFAKHYKEKTTISKGLMKTLDDIQLLDSGNMVLNQCIYASLDMYLHGGESFDSVESMDQKILRHINNMGILEKGEDYKMYASFSHIFDGGYAAGYYSYMWSEILELDVRSEFQKAGIFNKEINQKFYSNILSQGSKKKGKELFYDFCGRDMSLTGFLKTKGL